MDRPRAVMHSTFATALCLGLAGVLVPSCKEGPPPLGEALVIVDTDAPVPLLAGRLRIDFYSAEGAWFESRDVAAPDPKDWPVSFSVYLPDGTPSRSVTVRLRAYAEGKTRDYLGERFASRTEERALVPRRLVVAGVDETPRSEPQPLLAIDRLVRLSLEPGTVGSARLVLRGECFGTMADLAAGTSCVATENVREPLAPFALDPDMTRPTTSEQGSFGKAEPCEGAPREGEVCVPGGVFVFGNASEYGREELSGVPERVAKVSAFYMDRFEMTVARWRTLNAGLPFSREPVIRNEGPLEATSRDERDRRLCSASESPRGREDYALTCVVWRMARSLCRAAEGDLPTEVQWEYAAQAAGRATETPYPWGYEEPSCSRVVYGRFGGGLGRGECVDAGPGPQPVAVADRADGDVSPLGIVGLGGGVSELTRDALFGFDSPCWRANGLRDPSCSAEASEAHARRGGSWSSNAATVGATSKVGTGAAESGPQVGFRCVRAGSPLAGGGPR